MFDIWTSSLVIVIFGAIITGFAIVVTALLERLWGTEENVVKKTSRSDAVKNQPTLPKAA